MENGNISQKLRCFSGFFPVFNILRRRDRLGFSSFAVREVLASQRNGGQLRCPLNASLPQCCDASGAHGLGPLMTGDTILYGIFTPDMIHDSIPYANAIMVYLK